MKKVASTLKFVHVKTLKGISKICFRIIKVI